MGKKAIEDIIKAILISAISILFSVTLTRRAIIDKKLDKVEYKEDQTRRWNDHGVIHSKDDKRRDEMYDMIKFLYEEQMKKTGS